MAKIVDAIGNELRQYDTVKWDFAPGRWVLASLEEVTPLGLLTLGGREAPGKVVLRVEIAVPSSAQVQEQKYGFAELVKTFHPASDNIIERLGAAN